MKCLSYIFITLSCVSILAQSIPVTIGNNIDTHLNQYSEYNSSHHDNIDDEPHSHTHKHSEDGEEHDHQHEHTKISQADTQFITDTNKELAQVDNYKTSNNFFVNSLISNPHPLGVFRPPIS